jgi:hypothetical protein
LRLIAISSLALVALLTGCVGSVQPVYTDSDLVYDAGLLGGWRDSASSATATVSAAKSSAYAIALTDEDGKQGQFTAHLARVGEMTLLDVEPQGLPEALSETYRDHFVPLHSFFFVTRGKDRLALITLEPDRLSDFLRAQPGAVPHFLHDHDIVLTGEPRVIQAFLASYRQRPGVLGDSLVWKRSH